MSENKTKNKIIKQYKNDIEEDINSILVADKDNELLQVLDENGNPTGRFEKREIVHGNKLFHNEVSLWIIDKENKKVLLQRRNPNKSKILTNLLSVLVTDVKCVKDNDNASSYATGLMVFQATNEHSLTK